MTIKNAEEGWKNRSQSPLEVDKELVAGGRLITPMQKRRLRLSIMLEVNGYVR